MIKCRIYNKTTKNFGNFNWKFTDYVYVQPLKNQENYVVQQWTGLQDKNGLDIYEGDVIIDWKECKVLTIKKNDSPIQFLGESFYLDSTMTDPDIFSFALHNEPNRYEVIGTIFGLKEKPCKPDHNGECLICDCWLNECHLHEHLKI